VITSEMSKVFDLLQAYILQRQK